MSLAERNTASLTVGASGEGVLPGYRSVGSAGVSRESLGPLRIALDVLLATLALVATHVVTSSTQAALAAVALAAAASTMGRSRSVTLAAGTRLLDELPRILQVATTATVLVLLAVGLAGGAAVSTGTLAATWALIAGACGTSHLIGATLARRLVPVERCLVVGPAARSEAFERWLGVEGLTRLAVVARVDSDQLGPSRLGLLPIERLLEEHRATRVIVLCGDNPAGAAQAARRARNAGARVTVAPETIESIGRPDHTEVIGGTVLLSVGPASSASDAMAGKRAFDVAGALAALIAFGPLMLAIAAAIKLTSAGPVLFWQDRIGLDGRRFRIAKFRSMVVGAEAQKAALLAQNEAGVGLFKMAEDPRVTRIGRLVRRTSLDELPQLLNVLRGDMSLVGPRPLVCDEDALIGGWYRDRLRLKPGMTGRWQIMGSARIPMQEMLALDQQYVAGWSLWMDVKILLGTVGFVLQRRGI